MNTALPSKCATQQVPNRIPDAGPTKEKHTPIAGDAQVTTGSYVFSRMFTHTQTL